MVVRSNPVGNHEHAMREAAAYLHELGATKERILYSHVLFAHYFPVPVTLDERWDCMRDLAAASPTTFVVWNSNISGLLG